jgi:GNAT superfamily N-acetyltransferase
MEVHIKRLTPELLEDYLEYFDHIAFTDHKEWEYCYCVFYHWNEEFEEESKLHAECSEGCFKRELAERLIRDGALQGYLAYVDGAVVGWCNVNEKDGYSRLSRSESPELWDEDDKEEKVKAIVFFSIAPGMRHKGIATQLLYKICEDAISEGYDYIEGYPMNGEFNVYRHYHGPKELFDKFGFTCYKELENMLIVRKSLR